MYISYINVANNKIRKLYHSFYFLHQCDNKSKCCTISSNTSNLPFVSTK